MAVVNSLRGVLILLSLELGAPVLEASLRPVALSAEASADTDGTRHSHHRNHAATANIPRNDQVAPQSLDCKSLDIELGAAAI